MDQVVLVDLNGHETGTMGKLETHRKGKLHRAFSIFVFNSQGELLLQQRAPGKYHSGLLWANTCCSHPLPGEPVLDAGHRRLMEEMGFDCDLKEISTLIYKKKVGPELTEYEYDHILIGVYDGRPIANPEEAQDTKWVSLNHLAKAISNDADNYTYWLKLIIELGNSTLVREFHSICPPSSQVYSAQD